MGQKPQQLHLLLLPGQDDDILAYLREHTHRRGDRTRIIVTALREYIAAHSAKAQGKTEDEAETTAAPPLDVETLRETLREVMPEPEPASIDLAMLRQVIVASVQEALSALNLGGISLPGGMNEETLPEEIGDLLSSSLFGIDEDDGSAV